MRTRDPDDGNGLAGEVGSHHRLVPELDLGAERPLDVIEVVGMHG